MYGGAPLFPFQLVEWKLQFDLHKISISTISAYDIFLCNHTRLFYEILQVLHSSLTWKSFGIPNQIFDNNYGKCPGSFLHCHFEH